MKTKIWTHKRDRIGPAGGPWLGLLALAFVLVVGASWSIPLPQEGTIPHVGDAGFNIEAFRPGIGRSESGSGRLAEVERPFPPPRTPLPFPGPDTDVLFLEEGTGCDGGERAPIRPVPYFPLHELEQRPYGYLLTLV